MCFIFTSELYIFFFLFSYEYMADFFVFVNGLLSETSGTVRKAGGNFKEKLRELGGLDAVFEVSMSCHSDMEV